MVNGQDLSGAAADGHQHNVGTDSTMLPSATTRCAASSPWNIGLEVLKVCCSFAGIQLPEQSSGISAASSGSDSPTSPSTMARAVGTP